MNEIQTTNMEQALTTTPVTLLEKAIEKGVTVDSLEKLMALQERWEANQARKLFFESLAQFQKKCPVLKKNKVVAFNSTKYKYVQLPSIVAQIKDILTEFGLTYRWEIKDESMNLSVTCIITHKEGHYEMTSMSAAADDSGAKNKIQARGSAITYLQRYTLIGALGISSADDDNDGRTSEKTFDELRKDFMNMLNPLIQQDAKKWSPYLPDNWKQEQTIETLKKAIESLKQKTGQ